MLKLAKALASSESLSLSSTILLISSFKANAGGFKSSSSSSSTNLSKKSSSVSSTINGGFEAIYKPTYLPTLEEYNII
ncbi:hypothetical protein Hanom_Chr12g01136201 [Helianthus anomalus]